MKFKKQKVLCACEFSWFANNVLGILALMIPGTIFDVNICFRKSETAYFFCTFAYKNYTSRMSNFYKIKKTKSLMCI